MISSYEQNYYGEIIRELVQHVKPAKAVELGVLHGYSTRYIAEGLKLNFASGIAGHLDSYDLWDAYKYKHGKRQEVQAMLREQQLDRFVTLRKGDAFRVHKRYKTEVNFLHVDISNTGETVRRIMELWDSKIPWGGMILFEGGSEERDNVEWMVKYKMPSLRQELLTNPIIDKFYTRTMQDAFPSITILRKDC
jgi:predicted O-methyltransferase YrrM